jgi:hypothetical protein
VATVEASHTGRFLAEVLAGRGAGHLSPPGEPPAPGDVKAKKAARKAAAKKAPRAKAAARA